MTVTRLVVLPALFVLATGCATTRLGHGTSADECGERGKVAVQERVEGKLGAETSCQSDEDRWFNEYSFRVDKEQWVRFVLTSAQAVELTLLNPAGEPVTQFSTDGDGDPMSFLEFPAQVTPGEWVLQVAMKDSNSSGEYALTVYDGKYNLEGTCWIPDAERLALGGTDGEKLTLSSDRATCKNAEGTRSIIRSFKVSDVTDVTIWLNDDATMRLLNDEGTPILWVKSDRGDPPKFGRTFAPGTYYAVFGWPSSGDLEITSWQHPSLVRTPPKADGEAKEAPGCDDPSKRPVLELGKEVIGRIDFESCHRPIEPTDFNVYRLEVPRRDTFRIRMSSDSFSPRIVIEDEKGHEIAEELNPRVASIELLVALEPGSYAVNAGQEFGTEAGSYRLVLDRANELSDWDKARLKGHLGPALFQWISRSDFSAKLPGSEAPTPQSQVSEDEDGKVTVTTWEAEGSPGHSYVVDTIDFPPQWIAEDDPMAILHWIPQGVAEQMDGAKVGPIEPLQKDGKYPGVTFTIDSRAAHVLGRAYLVGPRVYRMMIFAPPRNPEIYEPEAFFDSLSLYDPPPPIPHAEPGTKASP